jgi:hypothetical protein
LVGEGHDGKGVKLAKAREGFQSISSEHKLNGIDSCRLIFACVSICD